MTGYSIRAARRGDLAQMRDGLGAAIQPAVAGRDGLAADSGITRPIVASVESAFRHGIGDPRQTVLVGLAGGRPGGFVILDRSGARAEIRWIVMLPEYVGSGLAQLMMDFVLREMDEAGGFGAIVSSANGRALGFFRRNGFEAGDGERAGRVVRLLRRPSGPRGD